MPPSASEPAPEPSRPPAARFPRVPAHAWHWLQRSRPVMAEVARRLTGAAPTSTFAEDLRSRFSSDPFTRAIVCEVVAEVAFSGRVPPRRPAGSSWDRGLVWWAATLTGVTPGEYDRPPPTGTQAPLFGGEQAAEPDAAGRPDPRRSAPPPVRGERAALAAALRALLAASDGPSVPAEAVRGLLEDLEQA